MFPPKIIPLFSHFLLQVAEALEFSNEVSLSSKQCNYQILFPYIGDSPIEFTALTLQPRLRRSWQVLWDPERAAQCSAMLPSVSVMRGSANLSSK